MVTHQSHKLEILGSIPRPRNQFLVNWNGAIKVKDNLYTLKVEHVVGVFEDDASVV